MLHLPYQKRPDFFRLNTDSPLSRGLVFAALGQFPGSDLCHDESLYRNHGALTNMDPPTDWVWAPELGRWALDLDGSNDYILLPSNVSAMLGGVSVAAFGSWVKRGGTGTRDVMVTLTISAALSKLAGEFQADNTIRFGGRADAYDSFQSKATTATFSSTTNWYHVLGVFDIVNDDILIYVDGILQATSGTPLWTQSTFDPDAGSSQVLGSGAGGLSNPFVGMLADCVLFTVGPSVSEIAQLADPSNAMLSGLILPPRRRIFPAAAAPPAGAIMNQMQGANLGADLFDGTILAA